MTPEINLGMEELYAEYISATALAEEFKLNVLYAEEGAKIKLSTVSVNRPGLILGGFDDYFAESRIQVMGNAEMYFLYKLGDEERDEVLRRLFKADIPCLIISRGLTPCKNMLEIARECGCPVFQSMEITSELVNDLINYLNDQLAPKTTVHGVLLDIDGVGVLLTGKSGIGKSETALELIHRGHMLVSDDSVELRRIKDKIIGVAPEKIRDLMELRGVGIINVRNMYGVAGVIDETQVDLVIELVEYDSTKAYGRADNVKLTSDLMGVDVPKLVIPVMMGRNLAIIVEVAAKNFRLQQLGYDANEEIVARIEGNLGK